MYTIFAALSQDITKVLRRLFATKVFIFVSKIVIKFNTAIIIYLGLRRPFHVVELPWNHCRRDVCMSVRPPCAPDTRLVHRSCFWRAWTAALSSLAVLVQRWATVGFLYASASTHRLEVRREIHARSKKETQVFL